MADQLPPDWAINKAIQLSGTDTRPVYLKDHPDLYRDLRAFARYIAEHEEEPVDPIVLEARNLVECTVHWSPQTDRDLQSGKNDDSTEMKIAIAALRRGIEIGKGS